MLKWRDFLLWTLGFISKLLFKSTLYHRLKLLILAEEESVEKSQEKRIDFSGRCILLSEDR